VLVGIDICDDLDKLFSEIGAVGFVFFAEEYGSLAYMPLT